MFGVIKEGKCYVLHKVKSWGTFSCSAINELETECGYKTFRECKLNSRKALGNFVDITRERVPGLFHGPKDCIVNPTDIYLSNRGINPNRYDEVCPVCFPNGVEGEK